MGDVELSFVVLCGIAGGCLALEFALWVVDVLRGRGDT